MKPLGTLGSVMKKVEYWRWAFKDSATGRVCRTTTRLTADQAKGSLPNAERIPGTLTLSEVEDESEVETVPSVFPAGRIAD